MAAISLLVGVLVLLCETEGVAAASNCAKPNNEGFLTCELDCCYTGNDPYCCASVMTILGFVSLAVGIVSSVVIVICCCVAGRCCCQKNRQSSVYPDQDPDRSYPQRNNWSKQHRSNHHHDNVDDYYRNPAHPPPYSSPSPRFGDPAYPPGKGPSPRGYPGYGGGYGAPY